MTASGHLLHFYTFRLGFKTSHLLAVYNLQTKNVYYWGNISFLLVAEQECGGAGRAFQPEGERSCRQHGPRHDHRVLFLLAALHGTVSGSCRGSNALHPSTGCHHAHVLCQDQPRLQPHYLLPFQQAGKQLR